LIVGLLALGGLWSRATPFQVVGRSFVDAGAVIAMAQALLARRYAVLAVSGALVLLYNPLAPVFELSGELQRALLVAGATPFLAFLIWRDLKRKAGNRTGTTAWKRFTNMINDKTDDTPFREGDEVVLAHGSYQGTLGVFLRLGKDVNWAEITERNGNVRSHPLVWLAHSPLAVSTVLN
jgi:hypothetical protein